MDVPMSNPALRASETTPTEPLCERCGHPLGTKHRCGDLWGPVLPTADAPTAEAMLSALSIAIRRADASGDPGHAKSLGWLYSNLRSLIAADARDSLANAAIGEYVEMIDELNKKLLAADADRQRMERDAARYAYVRRRLSGQLVKGEPGSEKSLWLDNSRLPCGANLGVGEELVDAAIDAARSPEGEPND